MPRKPSIELAEAAQSPAYGRMSTAQKGLLSAALAIEVDEPAPVVLTPQAAKAGQSSLLAHVQNCKATTGKPYLVNWHLEQLAAALEKLYRGEITRLMVLMPPRHGKSELVSRHFPAWCLGQNPDEQIIACSYSADLAAMMGVAVQRIMHQIEYCEEFGTRIAGTANERQAQNSVAKAQRQTFFEVANGSGYYLGAGVGGPITGKGFTLGIIDDPIKNRKEAESKTILDSINDWWDSTFSTRGEGGMAPGGEERILVTLTPWNEGDLSGHILRQARETGEDWVVIRFPALAEEAAAPSPDALVSQIVDTPDGSHIRSPTPDSPGDGIGPASDVVKSARAAALGSGTLGPLYIGTPGFCHDPRQPGEALWPDKYGTRKLEVIRERNARDWASLYQCRPAPDKGSVFERPWWKWYDSPQALPEMQSRCFSIDASFKDLSTSSYCVMQLWGVVGPDRYLLKQWRRRLDFPALLDLCRSVFPLYPEVLTKLIEEKANGAALISMLKDTFPGIVPINPRDSKFVRALAVQDFVRGGNVYLPRFETWAHELVVEASAFPNGLHDDMVDAMVQMLLHYQYNPVTFLEAMVDNWMN